MNQRTKPIQKMKKEVKSNNLCYCKVGRLINEKGAIEKMQYCFCNIWQMSSLIRHNKLFRLLEGPIMVERLQLGPMSDNWEGPNCVRATAVYKKLHDNCITTLYWTLKLLQCPMFNVYVTSQFCISFVCIYFWINLD